ncbi:hypothetical protein [Litorivivens sp.]|uniref:hypothetical protein n=1 Tax=Litorivivens sp. TaxID=2020868 RepID=UPI003567DFE5
MDIEVVENLLSDEAVMLRAEEHVIEASAVLIRAYIGGDLASTFEKVIGEALSQELAEHQRNIEEGALINSAVDAALQERID